MAVIEDILIEVGKMGLWIRGIGLVFVLWLLFQIAITVNNRIRRKMLGSIERRLESIEQKIDKLAKSKK
jgi:hypothetical protein